MKFAIVVSDSTSKEISIQKDILAFEGILKRNRICKGCFTLVILAAISSVIFSLLTHVNKWGNNECFECMDSLPEHF